MKTLPQTSSAGTVDPLLAIVLGLIALGVVLLGWEWHSAHPGKHARAHETPDASRPAESAVVEPADPGTGSNPAAPEIGAKKKHHKHPGH